MFKLYLVYLFDWLFWWWSYEKFLLPHFELRSYVVSFMHILFYRDIIFCRWVTMTYDAVLIYQRISCISRSLNQNTEIVIDKHQCVRMVWYHRICYIFPIQVLSLVIDGFLLIFLKERWHRMTSWRFDFTAKMKRRNFLLETTKKSVNSESNILSSDGTTKIIPN